MIIVPDRTCTGLEASGYNYYCNFTDKLEYRKAEELSKVLETKLQTSKEGYSSDFRIRILQRNNGMSMALLSKLLFYYGGIILLIICFTLLSLQQLADSSDFKHRFMIIKKMGISNPSLNKIVLGQMGIWFGLPILLAVISAWIVGDFFIHQSYFYIKLYIGMDVVYRSIYHSLMIILILFLCYFISTWILFKKNIDIPSEV